MHQAHYLFFPGLVSHSPKVLGHLPHHQKPQEGQGSSGQHWYTILTGWKLGEYCHQTCLFIVPNIIVSQFKATSACIHILELATAQCFVNTAISSVIPCAHTAWNPPERGNRQTEQPTSHCCVRRRRWRILHAIFHCIRAGAHPSVLITVKGRLLAVCRSLCFQFGVPPATEGLLLLSTGEAVPHHGAPRYQKCQSLQHLLSYSVI